MSHLKSDAPFRRVLRAINTPSADVHQPTNMR